MKPRLLVLSFLAAGVLWCAPDAPAAAADHVDAATDGHIDASLRYRKSGEFEYQDVRLQIKRDGRTLLDAPVPAPCSDCAVIPAGAPSNQSSLDLEDLDGDGEPEVIVDLFTGGAHCCTVSLIYGYRPAVDGYRHIMRNWADPSYTLADIDHDGRPEFKTLDSRFEYEFTAYAFSSAPIQIWQYRAGKLVDVTRHFPNQIRHDLKRQRTRYRKFLKAKYDVRGPVAGFAADEYLLGRGKAGWRFVLRAYARGQLQGPKGDFAPSGRKYLKRLRAFLHKLHYR